MGRSQPSVTRKTELRSRPTTEHGSPSQSQEGLAAAGAAETQSNTRES